MDLKRHQESSAARRTSASLGRVRRPGRARHAGRQIDGPGVDRGVGPAECAAHRFTFPTSAGPWQGRQLRHQGSGSPPNGSDRPRQIRRERSWGGASFACLPVPCPLSPLPRSWRREDGSMIRCPEVEGGLPSTISWKEQNQRRSPSKWLNQGPHRSVSVWRDGPTSTGRCSVRRSVRDSHRRAFPGQFSEAPAWHNDSDLSPRSAVYQRWSAPAPTPVTPAGGVARCRSLLCWTPGDQSQWRSCVSSSASAILALATSGSSWSQAAQADPSSDSSSSVSRCWEGSSI